MIDSISTSHVAGSARLDYWNGLIATQFPGMNVDASPDIDAQWATCRLGDMAVSIARSPKARIGRWQGGAPGADSGRGLVHLQHTGFSRTDQRGRSATLMAGDGAYCAADEPTRSCCLNATPCLSWNFR